MDELQIAHYISTLLDEKEREVEKEQRAYNEIYRSNPSDCLLYTSPSPRDSV